MPYLTYCTMTDRYHDSGCGCTQTINAIRTHTVMISLNECIRLILYAHNGGMFRKA